MKFMPTLGFGVLSLSAKLSTSDPTRITVQAPSTKKIKHFQENVVKYQNQVYS